MKFPKLHQACSNDDLRPAMSCVKVDKQFTFASDGHILVRHNTSELFKDDFVESIPEAGIMIPRRAIMLMVKKATIKVALTEDKESIQLRQMDGSVITYKCICDQQYPDANKIIPNPKDCKPLPKIGFSTSLLSRLSDAMGCDIPILHLTFFKNNLAIYCTSPHTDYVGTIGIIMPVSMEQY